MKRTFLAVAFARLVVACASPKSECPVDRPTSDPSLYTSATPQCLGCPDSHADPSAFVGKTCGDPSATKCRFDPLRAPSAIYLGCCHGTWTERMPSGVEPSPICD